MSTSSPIPEGVRRIFTEGFRVGDIAEPLVSFDEATSADAVAKLMDEAGFDAVGVRRRGRVVGYFEKSANGTSLSAESIRAFDWSMVIPESASLLRVVRGLEAQPRVFVTAFGEVSGIVTREDLEKPAVRMWLFGVVTMVEMRYTKLIAESCPGESWREYLSDGRLAKAESLLAERQRRQQSLTLLDCLQLSDKGQIVARNERIRVQTIFRSRNQAEEAIKLLESLRNNLAHAQEIVSPNWEAIVRLAQHLDDVLNADQPAQTKMPQ